MTKKSKTLWQVYTPPWIVSTILDYVNYNGDKILKQKIFEPSFWDGIFLLEIVKRILQEAKNKNLQIKEIKNILETKIFWIELDEIEYSKAITNLNNYIKLNLDENLKIKWNLIHWDTLIEYKQFIWQFDYVVWNPPFIRIHNLEKITIDIIKNNFEFTDWNLDIYTSFFELGLKLLNKTWKLWYITPNSFLHNTSYKNFRNYLKKEKLLKILLDFKWTKVFKWYSTYTAISIMNFNRNRESFNYKEYIKEEIEDINNIKYEILEDKDWSFSTEENMIFLKNIKNNKEKIKNYFEVQYWLWTLRDKIYIWKIKKSNKKNLVLFNEHLIENAILKKIIKASTFKWNLEKELEYIIFPYDEEWNVYKENILKEKYPYTYNYLLNNKTELLKRDLKKDTKWYEFWRSQWIKNINKEKVILSTLTKDKITPYKIDKDIYVYSWLFIIKKENKDNKISFNDILETLTTKDFLKYIRLTWKDLSGWYKTISWKLYFLYNSLC